MVIQKRINVEKLFESDSTLLIGLIENFRKKSSWSWPKKDGAIDYNSVDWLEYFMWYANTITGLKFKQYCRGIVQVYDEKISETLKQIFAQLQNIKTISTKFDIFVVVDKHEVIRIGTRPKDIDSFIEDEFTNYAHQYSRMNNIGERYNIPEVVSEHLIFLDPMYKESFRYISKKICEKGKPSKCGDGFQIDGGLIKEIEIKATASGGVRNTFSAGQTSHNFTVISIDETSLKDWNLGIDVNPQIEVSIYTCSSSFTGYVEQLAKTKTGNSRPEISGMIELLETRKEFVSNKHISNISIKRPSF